jgi:hypothetical protein
VTIANEFGIHFDSEKIREICRRYRERNGLDEYFEIANENNEIQKDLGDKDLEDITYKETIEINKDGSQTSDKLIQMSSEDCKDVTFLLKSHGYDPTVWQLISARNNIWNTYSKKDGVQTLYSSKIVVKPLSEFIWNEKVIKELFEDIEIDYKNKIKIEPKQYEQNGEILVVPIADLHYGLLSDKYSTGNDYNLEIAEEKYYSVLYDVINRTENKKFEKVLFVVGNDFINFDNLNGTTAKGTQQDNNALWFSIVKKAKELIIYGIDLLTNISPVDIVYVPSNHDLHTMFGIMQAIEAWYRNDSNVNVINSPLPRKYYKFGKTLVSLSHDIKVKDALQIISSEAKKEWSDCNHIICMLAHLHQAMEYEKQGYLEVLRLPTVSGWSRWSNNMGYIQSESKNQSFIIHKWLGITDILNTVLPQN